MFKKIKRFVRSIFLNPIVTKEIKQRTRGLKFSFTVVGWLIVMTLFTLIFLKTNTKSVIEIREYKNSIVAFCCFLIFIFTGFFGLLMVILCSQTVAKERENQTLDILLTTPLTNFEIIIGKMIAAIGESVVLFFSSVPVLVLLYFYGITSMKNILMIMFYVFILILFYGSLSILLSTLIKKSIAATVIVVTIVILSTILSYFILTVGVQMFASNSAQLNKTQGFLTLLSISISSAFSLFEFMANRMSFFSMSPFQYYYKLKGYQIHLIICVIGTILNIFLSTIFLSPLRKIRLAKRGQK